MNVFLGKFFGRSARSKEIEKLLSNREAFNTFVYTPLDVALRELQVRRAQEKLCKRVQKKLQLNIPAPLQTSPKAVLARHVTTPNYEIIRFLNVPDSTGLEPLFFEYHKDKLIYKNPGKYRLARLAFDFGIGKGGGPKRQHVDILDFNSAHGKEIGSVNTFFDKKLVDFHHQLFLRRFPHLSHALFDGSDWYAANGGRPEIYYEKFLGLFVCNGILFENFLLDQKEYEFTRDIFLPAFIDVHEKTGMRPLIVPLEPTDIEGDEFWLSYPPQIMRYAQELGIHIPEKRQNGSHAKI